MKTTPSKSHLAALLAALALPAGFAFGQAALPAPAGVNLQGTGNITNAPAVTLPNSTSATPTAPNFSWEGTNLLQGYLLPVSNFTGRTTTGGSVNYEDLLPLKVNKLQVMQGAAGAAPTGVGTLIDAMGIDTASVITDVLKVKDATTGTDVPITVNNGVLNVNGNSSGSGAQTLSLSGGNLSISNGNSITLPDTSSTNEIQTLSLSGDVISLSNGGGSISLGSLNTDSQSLNVSGNTLGISGGNSATLPNIYTTNGALTDPRSVTLNNFPLTFVGQVQGGVTLNLANVSNTNDSFAQFGIINDVSSFAVFLNSSTRTVAGGPNCATIRNYAGNLRLLGADSTGILVLNNGVLSVEGHELRVGGNDQITRGDSGASRALVKLIGSNNTSILGVNFAGDYAAGVVIGGNTTNITGNATINGQALVGSLLRVGGIIEVTGHDIQLGKNNLARGDSGLSRALVKSDNNTLVANFGGDFTGGVRIDSKVTIAGDSTQNLSNLYVGPATAGADGTFGYLNSTGAVGTAAGFQTFSIYGVNTIATGGEFRAYSDARIKEHVSSISSATSLETLNHLLLRKYRYKDTVMHGNKVKSGVFAQDVEKVFPEAVDYAMEFIPNVYQKATVSEGYTVQIKTDLSKGDKVRMYDAKNHEIVVEVTAVTSKNFTVDQKIEAKEVFVYGKQVKDFRHVDYDRLTVLNLSATQELAKRAEAQAKELATVKAEKTVLAQAVKTQAAEIASLKKQQAAEIAQIKAALEAMNKLVAAKVTEKATKVVSTTVR